MVCTFCHTVQAPPDTSDVIDRVQCLSTPLGVHCPVCDDELEAALIDSVPACYCPSCRGLLIKNSEFRQVVESRRAAYAGPDVAATLPHPVELDRRIQCPTCHQKMEVHPYYGAGRAIIDSCSSCQLVWIDMGELTSLEQTPGRRGAVVMESSSFVECSTQTVTTQTQAFRAAKSNSGKMKVPSLLDLLSQLLH